MKPFFSLFLLLVGWSLAAQNVCTITFADQGRDFCEICSEPGNQAITNGVFTGTLHINERVNYKLSPACLSSVTFAENVHFTLDFKATLVFEQDPTVAEGTQVTADFSKKVQVSIFAFNTLYEPYQPGRDFAAFSDRMMSAATTDSRVGGGGGDFQLPITLTEWTARTTGQAVDLTWATGSESGNDYFEVEYSTDGQRFAPLAYLPGAGDSREALAYSFRHATPLTGTNYYRLKQYDLDGTAHVFSVITAVLGQSPAAFTVYPNPAAAGTAVHFPAVAVVTDAQLFAADGRLVFTSVVRPDEDSRVTLPAGLASGVYVLRIGGQASRLTVR